VTFESGRIVDSADGATRTNGVMELETAAPIFGVYSARMASEDAFLERAFPVAPDLFASVYFRSPTLPALNVRIMQLWLGTASSGNIVFLTSGQLRLRMGTTAIGADSTALVPGQTYRVALRQASGSGANGRLEAYVARAGEPFGAPFASTTTGTWTSPVDRVRIGATSGTTSVRLVVDDLRLDGAAMPPGSQ
jgi:hypothetical protein